MPELLTSPVQIRQLWSKSVNFEGIMRLEGSLAAGLQVVYS